MDANAVVSIISSAMNDGFATAGTLLVALLGLAGVFVVWAKL